MTAPHSTAPEPFTGAIPPSSAELTEEIEATRAALGETVQALAAKADVKARMSGQAQQMRRLAAQQVRRVRAQARRNRFWLVAGAAASGLLVWRMWRRNR